MKPYIESRKDELANILPIENIEGLESFILYNITMLLEQKLSEYKNNILEEIQDFIIKKREIDKEVLINFIIQNVKNTASSPAIAQLLSDLLLYLFTSKKF